MSMPFFLSLGGMFGGALLRAGRSGAREAVLELACHGGRNAQGWRFLILHFNCSSWRFFEGKKFGRA